MGFGIATAGIIARQTNHTSEVASKMNEAGEIVEETTYGSYQELTEEQYSDSITNEAVNAQVGTTITGVVTNHNYIESNTEYARTSKTTRKPLT